MRYLAWHRSCAATLIAAACATGHAYCFNEATQRYGVEADLLRAIAAQESEGRPDTSIVNSNGSIDRGLMGINSVHLSDLGRLSRLSDLRPDEPVQRYERDNPGDLLHIDIKKLGRFDKVGHRITGDRTQRARNVGWDFAFVAVDDHSRLAFTQVYPDETKLNAEAFLRAAVGYFARMGVTVQRVLTDNGMSFRSALFGQACLELGIDLKFTRAYRPQTNGQGRTLHRRRTKAPSHRRISALPDRRSQRSTVNRRYS
jgi:transposase InsO family protein